MPSHVLQVRREAFEFLAQSGEGEECKLERIVETSNVEEIKIVEDEYLPDGDCPLKECVNFVIVGTSLEIDAAISLINYEVRNFESTNKGCSKDANGNWPVSRDARISDSTSRLDVDRLMLDCNIGKKMEDMVSSLLRSPDIRLPVTLHPDSTTNNATSRMTNVSTCQQRRKRYQPYGKHRSAISNYQEIVQVPHSVAGMVFGKGYLSVVALKEEFDVAVLVIPTGSDGSNKCCDVIDGFTPVRLKGVKEQVVRARNKLDLDVKEAEMRPDFSQCVKETIVVGKCDVDLLVGLAGRDIQKARDIRGVKKIKREADFEHSYSYAIYADDRLAADQAKKILTERAKEQMVLPKLFAQKVADEIYNLEVVSRVKLVDLQDKNSGDTEESLLVLEGQPEDVAAAFRIVRGKLEVYEIRGMAEEPGRVISSEERGFVILPTAVNIPENLRSATISKNSTGIILPTLNAIKINESEDSSLLNYNPRTEMLRENASQCVETNLLKTSQRNGMSLWENSQSNEKNLRVTNQRNETILQNTSQRNAMILQETCHSDEKNLQENIQTILRKFSQSNEGNSRETKQRNEANLQKISRSNEVKCGQSSEPNVKETYQSNENNLRKTSRNKETNMQTTSQNIETNVQKTSQNSAENSHVNQTVVVQVPCDVAGRVFGKKYILVRAIEDEFFLKRVYVVKREEIANNRVKKGVQVLNGYAPVLLFGRNDNVKRAKNQLERDISQADEKSTIFYSNLSGSILEIDTQNMDLMLGPNGKTLQKARDLINTHPFFGYIRRVSESPQLYTYDIRCSDENTICKVKKLLTVFKKDEIEVPKAIADELREKTLARNMVARVVSQPPGKGPNVKITLEGEFDDVVSAKNFIYEEWQARRKYKPKKVGKTVSVNNRAPENIRIASENQREVQKISEASAVDVKTTSCDCFNKTLGNVIQKYVFEAFKNQPLAHADYVCKDNMRVEVTLTEGIYCEALVVNLILDAVVVSLEGYNCITQLVVPFDKVRLVRENTNPNAKFHIGNEVYAKLISKCERAKCVLWCSGVVRMQSQKDTTHFPDLYLIEFTAGPLVGLTKRMPFNKIREPVVSVKLRKSYFSSTVVPIDKSDTKVINQITRPNAHKSYLVSVGAEMFVYDAASSKIILISKKKFDLRQVTELSASHFTYLRSLSKSADKKIPDLRDVEVLKPICEGKENGPVKSIVKFDRSSDAKKSINETANPLPGIYSQNQNSFRVPFSKIVSANNSNKSSSNVTARPYSEKFIIANNATQAAFDTKNNIKKAQKVPGISEVTLKNQTIEIFGKNVECVKKVRNMLEHRRESFFLKSRLVGSIIGKHGCNVKTIENQSGVKVSNYNFASTSERNDQVTRIELEGPASSVCHAKILVENLISMLLLSYTRMRCLEEQNRLDLEVEARGIGKATVIDVEECGKLVVESENGKTASVPFSEVKFPQFSKCKGPITEDTFYKIEIPIEEIFSSAAASYDHRNFQVATCASSCIYRKEARVLRLISRTVRTKQLVELLKNAHVNNVKKAQSCAIRCNSIEEEDSLENEKSEQKISSCQDDLAFTLVRSLKIPPHIIARVNGNGLSVTDYVVHDKILSNVKNQPGITSADLVMDRGCLSLKVRSLGIGEIEQAAKCLDYVQEKILIPTGTSGKIVQKLNMKCDAQIEFEYSQHDEECYTIIGTPLSVSRAKNLYSHYLDKYGRNYSIVTIPQSEILRQYMNDNLQRARDMPGICNVKEYPDHFAIYANNSESCRLATESLRYVCEDLPAQQPILTDAILNDIVDKCGIAEISFIADKMGKSYVYKIIGPVAKVDQCKKMISQMEMEILASKSSSRTTPGENLKGNASLHSSSSTITGPNSSNRAKKNSPHPDLWKLEKSNSHRIKIDDLASNSSLKTSVDVKSKESFNLLCSSKITGPSVKDNANKSYLKSDSQILEKSVADSICRMVKVDPNRVTDRIVKLSQNVTGIKSVRKVRRDEYKIQGDSKEAIDLAESALNYAETRVTVEGFITFSELNSKIKKEFLDALTREFEKNLEGDVARNVFTDFTLSENICNNLQFTFATAYIVGPEQFVEIAKNLLDSDASKLGKYFVFTEIGNYLRRFEKECLMRARSVEGVTCVVKSRGGILICGLTQGSCLLARQILKIICVTENVSQTVANNVTSSVVDKIKKDTGILAVDFLPANIPDEKSSGGKVAARIIASEVDLKTVVEELKKYLEKADSCPIQ